MAASRNLKGDAALSICESLLLCLVDRRILSHEDVLGILKDAAAAHRNAAKEGDEVDSNTHTAELITAIMNLRKPI